MAIAFVNRAAPSGATAVSAASLGTTSVANTAGNLLVARIIYQNPATVALVFDNAGNTWSLVGTLTFNNNFIDIWEAYNCLSSVGNILTVAMGTATTYGTVSYSQFSGFGTADPSGGTHGQTGNSTSPSTSNFTPTQSEGLIYASGIANVAGWSAGAGFTLHDDNVSGDATKYFMDEYKVITSANPADGTCGNNQWGIFGALFNPPGGGGGGISPWLTYAQMRRQRRQEPRDRWERRSSGIYVPHNPLLKVA